MKKLRCYLCLTLLEMKGKMGWYPKDKFWVDKPWEKRFEDRLLPGGENVQRR